MMRYSSPLHKGWLVGLPLLLMLGLAIFEPDTLDLALARLMYQPETGFIGRHSHFLEDVLHDKAKQLVIIIGFIALFLAIGAWLTKPLAKYRAGLSYLVLSLALSTSLVTPLKALTQVHCPWSLAEFGGSQAYSSVFSARPATDKPGRCWPGGHASAGFSLLALFFFWRDRRPRMAKAALLFSLTLGCVFSLGRMLQGAHFFSHNLWTLLIDWEISATLYLLLLYRPRPGTDNAAAKEGALCQP